MHIDPILSKGDTEKYKEYELINKRKQRVKTMPCWDSDSAYQNVHVRRMSEGEAAVARRTERSTFESAVSSDRGNFYPPPFPEYLTQKPRPFLSIGVREAAVQLECTKFDRWTRTPTQALPRGTIPTLLKTPPPISPQGRRDPTKSFKIVHNYILYM